MRVLLLMTDAPWYRGTGYAQAWRRALEAEGAQVEQLAGAPASWALGGPPGPAEVDLVVAHVLVEEVAAFGATLRAAVALEAAGARLLNPVASLLASADKRTTAAVWAAAGVPQPATWPLEEVSEAGTWPGRGRPLVLKPSLGDGARHLVLVRELEEARAVVAAWRTDEAAGGERRGDALLQEWVEEPACVRLLATPSTCSLAYEKNRDPGALVTSGTTYPRVYPPPPDMAALAQRMVSSLGGGLMGVDVLVDRDGRCLALEANAPFGFDVTDPEQGRFVARTALGHARDRLARAA